MSKRIKLQIDGQVLSEIEKTGIGWCVWHLVKRLTHADELDIAINYFPKGHSEEQRSLVHSFADKGAKIMEFSRIKSWQYKLHSTVLPISYSRIFGGDADVSCFMNYYIPPRVSGKKISIVYDMVAKAYPETMDFRTRVLLGTTLKSSIRRADRIITISQAAKGEIMKYYGVEPEKIAVMPMGVSERFVPGREGLAEIKAKYGLKDRYFMYLGTLEPRKNIETLLEAYALLKRELADCPGLVIAGRKGWVYEGIFRRAKELGIEEDTVFTGYLERGEIPPLLSGAEAFVFPSVYEGFGMPPLEAMACGCPVIVSSVSAMPEVAGGAGLLCSPKSPEEFKNAMLRIATDQSLAAELSKKGVERAKNYTWDAAAEVLVGVIRELAAES